MMPDIQIRTWRGKCVEEMTSAELLEAVQFIEATDYMAPEREIIGTDEFGGDVWWP